MATLPKVLISRADYQIGGGVALGLRTQDLVAGWYNNYAIEYVPDGGHFLMFEKPDLVVDRIKKSFLGASEGGDAARAPQP